MKAALVHYWLVTMRGGEKVLESLGELYPEAPIYTHVYDSAKMSDSINAHEVRTTLISRLPKANSWYQRYLGLMPFALEQLDMRDYDIVISSESGPAKGIITRPDALHICYCHSPMRYIWDLYPEYVAGKGLAMRSIMAAVFHYMRIWDVTSAARVDHFVANSSYVAKRIEKYYRREATVIHPPVDVGTFEVSERSEDFYLWIGQLTKYKRIDLAVKAFNESGKRLVIIGGGEEEKKARAAAGANISFLGKASDADIRDNLARCKALVFPGIEDFGIVPVEAMAAGKPVIAFRAGGATETVVEDETGIFFEEASPASLNGAISRFESRKKPFEPGRVRKHAERFDTGVFKEKMAHFIEEARKR